MRVERIKDGEIPLHDEQMHVVFRVVAEDQPPILDLNDFVTEFSLTHSVEPPIRLVTKGANKTPPDTLAALQTGKIDLNDFMRTHKVKESVFHVPVEYAQAFEDEFNVEI